MLQNLHVKNIALIDETEVDFGQGLNILTGETGAGKSILLGSVGLALGGKYSSDLLRNGAENGLVELTFSVDDGQIIQKLEEMDIIPDDGMVTLTRKFTGSRSISRINGETVNTGKLKEAAELLIDIHGQHDNKTLLQRKNHLVLLDLFGRKEIAPIKSEMSKCYKEYRAICKKAEETSLNDEERRRELSLYEFEVHEIEEAALRENEDEELEETYRRMTESRKITDAVAQTYRYTCEDSSANAGDCLTRAIRAFREAAEFDEEGDRLCALRRRARALNQSDQRPTGQRRMQPLELFPRQTRAVDQLQRRAEPPLVKLLGKVILIPLRRCGQPRKCPLRVGISRR